MYTYRVYNNRLLSNIFCLFFAFLLLNKKDDLIDLKVEQIIGNLYKRQVSNLNYFREKELRTSPNLRSATQSPRNSEYNRRDIDDYIESYEVFKNILMSYWFAYKSKMEEIIDDQYGVNHVPSWVNYKLFKFEMLSNMADSLFEEIIQDEFYRGDIGNSTKINFSFILGVTLSSGGFDNGASGVWDYINDLNITMKVNYIDTKGEKVIKPEDKPHQKKVNGMSILVDMLGDMYHNNMEMFLYYIDRMEAYEILNMIKDRNYWKYEWNDEIIKILLAKDRNVTIEAIDYIIDDRVNGVDILLSLRDWNEILLFDKYFDILTTDPDHFDDIRRLLNIRIGRIGKYDKDLVLRAVNNAYRSGNNKLLDHIKESFSGDIKMLAEIEDAQSGG